MIAFDALKSLILYKPTYLGLKTAVFFLMENPETAGDLLVLQNERD